MKNYNVVRQFESQVQNFPDFIAITDGTHKTSYKELNQKANQIARYLKTQDVKSGEFVAILLEPSLDYIILMLAIIKIGAAYLPLDCSTPEKRLASIIDDARPKLVITDNKYNVFKKSTDKIIDIKTLKIKSAHFPVENLSTNILQPNSPIYMMYTSGSTGTPKGVVISHQAVVNLCHTENYAKIKAQQYVSQFSNLAFDGATFEIWSALLNGAVLNIIPLNIRIDIDKLFTFFKQNTIDCLFLPTAFFHQCIKSYPHLFDSVKTIVFGGEQVNLNLLKDFIKYIKNNHKKNILINGYGPTEATTFTCKNIITTADLTDEDLMSIGKPFKNVRTYVLDEEMRPTNEGELYISGINLALGYHNSESQNKEKFLENPFCNDEPYKKIYKTGDKVKMLANGNLLCLGRLDDQVKVGGFRIHLNEIEQKLMTYPNIALAAVIVEIGGGQHKMLSAYIVLADKSKSIQADDIRNFLAESLPVYMLPSKYVMVESFPLTPVGKIDKKKLEQIPHTDLSYHIDATTSHPIEKKIQGIWCHLLNRSTVDIHKNFFDLGANSLLITESCALINKSLNSELNIADILSHPTIHKLSRYLEGDIDTLSVKPHKSISSSEIAIIGMSCRFPKANSLSDFWENLCHQVNCLERFDITKESNYVPVRGILSDIEFFDASFFGFNPMDATVTDPQHRVFLEVAWEALEHAGVAPQKLSDKTISVFAGMTDSTYLQENLLKNNWFLSEYDHFQQRISNSIGMLSTQLSYRLNLKGRSVNVNTACSTGLIAVDQAAQDLITGNSDIALAGAVSIIVPQQTGYYYQEGSIVSPTGQCLPFSDKANGTVFSNGVGVIILKRLDDAIADGDTIYAIIKGRDVNNDGSDKLGYTAPSHGGQINCILNALESAKINAYDIRYLETHGTATHLGDIVEFNALNDAFKRHTKNKQFCAIGSVKSNIGHTDVVAGIAGLIKISLCLHYKYIPPMPNFENPNQELGLEKSPFYINTAPITWDNAVPVYHAGVSAFGVGGTNIHMILSEYRAPQKKHKKTKDVAQLMILSAKSKKALEEMTDNLIQHLTVEKNQTIEFLAHTAFTLQTGREDLPYRRYAIGHSINEIKNSFLKNSIQYCEKSTKTNIVFMFPGQGTQYPQMAKELMQLPYFAKLVTQGSNIASKYLNCNLLDLLNEENSELLNETQYAQPTLFIIEYALAKLLMIYGIQPDALIGHSLGEYVAACLAGVFSFEDGVALVCERGMLMARALKGSMLSIACTLDDFKKFQKLVKGIELALHNSSQHCVASGTIEDIDLLERYLQAKHMTYQKLNVSHAFHSRLMESIEKDFIDMLSNFKLNTPNIPIVSNLTGEWLSAKDAIAANYWYLHLRNTVKLKNGLELLAKDTNSFFIEVGPKCSLSYFLKSILDNYPDHKYSVSNCLSPSNDTKQLLEVIGLAWIKSIPIQWHLLHPRSNHKKIALPTYAFQKNKYWIEPDGKLNSNTINCFQPVWTHEKIFDENNWNEDIFKQQTWIIIKDGCNLAHEFINLLKKHKIEPLIVEYAEKYSYSHPHFTINSSQKSHYLDFLKTIKEYQPPLIFLNVASYGIKTNTSQTKSQIETQLNYSFYNLLYLTQGLIEEGFSSTQVKIGIVSSGTQQPIGLDELNPLNATLIGASHVITQEHPNLKFKIFDLSVEDNISEKIINNVIKTCANTWDESFQLETYRRNRLWRLHYSTIKPSKHKTSRLRNHGVYLLTGGLGGIALSCCEAIAKTVSNPILILITRSHTPRKSEWEIIAKNPTHPDQEKIISLIKLEKLGATLHIYQVDITNFEDLNLLVQKCMQKFGTIHGLIHAAGISVSELVQSKHTDAVEQVFAPKIYGTFNLSKIFKDIPLDFVVLKSSLSAILGGFGQVDYAAANAFLDTISKSDLFNENTFVVTINWNTWREVGIAARNQKEGKMSFIGKGDDISPEEGKNLFLEALQGQASQVIISKKDINSIKEEKPDLTFQPSKISRDKLPTQVKYTPPNSQLESKLVQLWQESLAIDEIGINDDFFSLGGNSLQAINLIEKINKSLSCNLPMTQFYTTPTVKELATLIESNPKDTISSILIPLKHINNNPPYLFLFHPISGLINCFDAFVNLCDIEMSIYGLQDPNTNTKSLSYNTLEDMLNDYLKVIKKTQKNGPYYLLGYSFGGVIAYEIANKLKMEGQQIKFLGLIDSWAINSNDLQNEILFKNYLLSEHPDLSETIINLSWEREQLLLRYKLSQTNQEMLLFKATNQSDEFKKYPSTKNGWELFNAGNIICHSLDGTHQSIINYLNSANILYLIYEYLKINKNTNDNI